MDLTVQAMAGIMETTGYPDRPPVKAGPAVADFFAGVHLYGAIVTALFERERTGVARRVEVAMQDAVYASLSSSLGLHWGAGADADLPPRTGNRHGALAESPYNVDPTTDGYIAIICVGEAHWRSLTQVMGEPRLADDPRFVTQRDRIAHMDLVDAIVTDWTYTQTKSELFTAMMAARIPCAPVRALGEVMNDENMHARGALTWLDHPEYGRIVVQQSPFRFDGVADREPCPSRSLGADNQIVLSAGEDVGSDPGP